MERGFLNMNLQLKGGGGNSKRILQGVPLEYTPPTVQTVIISNNLWIQP